ncbi:MAG: Gfo/Idh/MocA family oxidoreductase [Planctomycetes bacterium]|nr:Gfo/Idh/MocA family oxidoreductase [Planctomycetota bacterium]MCH9725892.1 Gfo/Idh/MocA family oxidoreductase [Planctomycetota bacterium]MCH9777045.1 Gfo/Idh/MocA family oxidoreductase [Planctomycetota bacterium]MCH9791231.1 Gfo/Idh/MocA family oxidoreductase [Planctomycetota bacterium]
MGKKTIRIGIVGAGANTKSRHIPGFQALEDVEIVGVVNSTPASTEKVARKYGIPQTYSSWQELVEDPEIDAVMIGTWPNLHCDITCMALESGKHVLTEARMARNLAEAEKMLKYSQARPDLVAQVVPSPFGLKCNQEVIKLISQTYLGNLREVVVLGADDTFWDYSNKLHWRQDKEISGNNVLTLGILHETLSRWVPPTESVFAQSSIFEPQRPSAHGQGNADVTIPESLQVVTRLLGGANAIYHLSGSILFGPGLQIHLYGDHGTIKVQFTPEEKIFVGHLGEDQMKEIQIPKEEEGFWRVEAEFIGAIRGEEIVHFTDFATGVKYMEFTEAVALSCEKNEPVTLPL